MTTNPLADADLSRTHADGLDDYDVAGFPLTARKALEGFLQQLIRRLCSLV
jgi:hypothetical protein